MQTNCRKKAAQKLHNQNNDWARVSRGLPGGEGRVVVGGLSQDRQTITKINKSNDKGKLWKGQGVGAGAGVQANLSSGKCIQMNVVILSNILRDAAVADADAAVAAQDTSTTFQWQLVHATNSGTSTTGLTHALEI